MLPLLVSVVFLAPNDEAAIHRIYRLKNRYYQTKDAKRLRPTDLPTFFAEDLDGSIHPNDKIWDYMHWRFRVQTKCRRNERPVAIKVKENDAVAIVFCDDDWTGIDKQGRRFRTVTRTKGRSYWTKTPNGWKQASLHFDVSETKQPDGTWRRLTRATKG